MVDKSARAGEGESRRAGARGPAQGTGGGAVGPARGEGAFALGASLRKAWVGYRRQLDEEMARAGFGPRSFPDGRVLRLCARSSEVTISDVGRALGVTRQAASKTVGGLCAQGYVTLTPSAADRREKLVLLTDRATDYLAAQRAAARRIERRLRQSIGDGAFEGLRALLDELGHDQPRLRSYLAGTTGSRDEDMDQP